MKVKDLIKALLEVDQDAKVLFQMDDGCCGDYFELDNPDLDLETDQYKDEKWVQIRFPSLPFLSSCISSGLAQRAVAKHRKIWDKE